MHSRNDKKEMDKQNLGASRSQGRSRILWISMTIFVNVQLLFVTIAVGSNKSLQKLDHATTADQINQATQELQSSSVVKMSELKEYAQDRKKDGQNRYRAVRATYRDRSSASALKEIIGTCRSDQDRSYRFACVMDMAQENDSLAKEFLHEKFADAEEDNCLQMAAGASLAAHGDKTAKDRALATVLSDGPCSDFAMLTLANLKATDVIPQLQRTMAISNNNSIKNSCRLAILRIELRDKSMQEQIKKLKETFYENGFYRSQQWAANYLAAIGSKQALTALTEVYNDKTAFGREAAVSGLQMGVQQNHWTDAEVRSLLIHE